MNLLPIENPPDVWESPLEAFEFSLAHEQKVTGLINALVNLAMDEKDHATYNMLQWYVDEQIEEEANAEEIVRKLSMIGEKESGGVLYMLDRELATRVYTPLVVSP